MSLPVLSKEVIEKVVKSKNYKWFEDKVNIVSIRTNDKTTNVFNDYITISYKDKTGAWNFIGYNATTDPGLYWLKKPSNVKGTAILVPNQYINCWALGKHSGYDALVQIGGSVAVYRDRNMDNYLDMDKSTIDVGYFGINIHRAHLEILQLVIEKYSAGCQVIQRGSSFNKFIEIIKDAKQSFYSYTLLTENDFK